MAEITKDRLAGLADLWNAETNDTATQEWRDDLTPEESKIIDDWDRGYASGLHKILQDIIALHREGECHG